MKRIEPISQELNDLATLTIDAAMKVHRTLGPGLLESVYEACLLYELRKMGFTVESQTQVPVHYEGVYLNTNLRIDILVENSLP